MKLWNEEIKNRVGYKSEEIWRKD